MKILVFICLSLFSLAMFVSAEVPCTPQLATCNSQLAPPIRAAYFLLAPFAQAEERLRSLNTHGFNAALVADGSYRLKEELWRKWAMSSAQYDIQLFPVLNFAVPHELKGTYIPYTTRDGELYQATPCPLDEDYWDTVIGERFARLAEFSKVASIAGLVFDTEMYGSDISLYSDLCYCNSCWQQFIHSDPLFTPMRADIRQEADHLPKEKRFEYLVQHDLVQQYTTFQWKRVCELLSQIEQQIHRINPDLQIGFLGYRHNWFYAALVQGLSTPDKPVLVFSESSYVRGYTPYVEREKKNIKKLFQSSFPQAGKSAQYVPGLWLDRFFPQDLPSQLTDLAVNTDGYWIYTANNLWKEESKSKKYALHGSLNAYWTALKRANNELIRLSCAPGSPERRIPAIRQSSFYDPSQRRLFTTPALKQLLGQMKDFAVKSRVDIPVTYRAQTLFHCLQQQEGSIRISHVPLGKDTNPEIVRLPGNETTPVSYMLFDGEGNILQEGKVTPDEHSIRIALPPNRSKTIALLTNSGVNAAQISFSGLSCVVEASSTFPLETFQSAAQHYELIIPPPRWGRLGGGEQERLQFRAHCPGQESAFITIQSPDDSMTQSAIIRGFTEFQIENDSDREQNYWRITITPGSFGSYGDLRFYLYDNKFPYLIRSAN